MVDALSRKPQTELLTQLTLHAPHTIDIAALKEAVKADKELCKLLLDIEQDCQKNGDFTVEDGVLYRKGCLVIPA